VKAHADITGRNCPYCRFSIKEGTDAIVCPTCGSPHHNECWNDNQGCAITACASGPASTSGRPSEPQAQPIATPSAPLTSPKRQPPVGRPPSGRSSRDRARNAVLFASLIAILVLGVALAFVVGKNNGRGATTTELVTTDSPHTSPAVGAATTAQKKPSTGTSSQPPASNTPTLQSYSGSDFSMMVPSRWVEEVNERQIGREAESKWVNPAPSSEYVLLDVHTPVHTTMREGAEPVREQLAKQAGYTQIYYGPGDLSQHPESWMWIFEVEGNERIDYFFETCSNTIAVLGSTTPSRFDGLRGTFRAVADSFRPSCE
jgi:hypothetical protein